MKLRLPAVGIGSSSEEAGSKRQRQSSRAAKSTSQRRLSQGSQIGVVAAQPGAMRKVGRSAAEQTSPRSEQRLRLPPVCPSHTPEQPDGVSSASLSAGSYYSSFGDDEEREQRKRTRRRRARGGLRDANAVNRRPGDRRRRTWDSADSGDRHRRSRSDSQLLGRSLPADAPAPAERPAWDDRTVLSQSLPERAKARKPRRQPHQQRMRLSVHEAMVTVRHAEAEARDLTREARYLQHSTRRSHTAGAASPTQEHAHGETHESAADRVEKERARRASRARHHDAVLRLARSAQRSIGESGTPPLFLALLPPRYLTRWCCA